MKNQLLVTAFGEDRPGIVARLTEVFVGHGANVEESRMALLGGEFAAIVLISIDEKKIDALKQDLEKLTKEKITVTTKPTRPIDASRFTGYATYEITLNGADHEGIVHQVSSYLHDRSINIQSMETSVVHAPVSATPLFQMKALVMVPPALSADELQKSLDEIGRRENVQIIVGKAQAAVGVR